MGVEPGKDENLCCHRAAILLPLGVFQAQKNRLPAVTTLLLIALIILEFIFLVPGAGLEPAQP
ncbi:TPA: hypothetical protein PCU81_002420 [Staphylococcus aureus]|nr:hypothetical protein [Staphylococcus aureus]